MKKTAVTLICTAALTAAALLFSTGCRIAAQSSPQPLIVEGAAAGSASDGVYSTGICKWVLPSGGDNCKIIASHPAKGTEEITLLNGPAGTTETLVTTAITGPLPSEDEAEELVRTAAEQELAGLKASTPGLKTGELERFEYSGISGYYFGCRAEHAEMGITLFMTHDPAYLCSYSFSRMTPGRRGNSREKIREMTLKGLSAITFYDLSKTVFSMGR